MPESTIPIDQPRGTRTIDVVLRNLPVGWSVMPVGAVAMMGARASTKAFTKDVDVVPFVVTKGAYQIPSWDDVVVLARTLGQEVKLRKDQTSVEVRLILEEGPVRLELIRGRRNDGGGYFVTRRVLEACAQNAAKDGQRLTIRPEALAVLKAWAAIDQEKLVVAGKDGHGFHAARILGFRQDVASLARSFADRGEKPDATLLRTLVNACPAGRRVRVERTLKELGFPV